MTRPLDLYICDKKKCENCSYPDCKFTTDILHQLKIENSYDGETLEQQLCSAADQLLDGVYDKDSLAELLMDARNTLIYYQFFENREEKVLNANPATEEQLEKLKVELDYAKFQCALPTIIDTMKGENR